MSEEPVNTKPDGRKYDVGDKVDFTDDDGKVVPGVVHAVRYQLGHYEWLQAERPDMHSPEGPDNQPIPGTGRRVLIKGTEDERHSFEYIMVHEHQHKAWWDHENSNQAKIASHKNNVAIHRKKHKDLSDKEYEEKFLELPDHPISPVVDVNHPPLKQHLRIYEEDKA